MYFLSYSIIRLGNQQPIYVDKLKVKGTVQKVNSRKGEEINKNYSTYLMLRLWSFPQRQSEGQSKVKQLK